MRTRVLLFLGLLAVTSAAYLPAFSAGFVWDDDRYPLRVSRLNTVAGLAKIWTEPRTTPQYYPLVYTTFWLESQLWGTQPRGFHAVNIALHALNAFLVGVVLFRLGLPWPWLAAALFALHPVHVESVAWVTERKNLLSGAFALAATALYVPWAGLGPTPEEANGRARRYGLILLLFVAALLSKSVTAMLPACLAILCWWKFGRLRARDLRALFPLFVVGAASGLFTAWLERSQVGALGIEWDLSPAQRVLIAGRALWFYLASLAWPSGICFQYPRWSVDAAAGWQWLFPGAALAVGAGLWARRATIGRGPAAAAGCFAAALFPALGFFNVYPMRYSFVADHFQYLASIAPIAVFATAAARVAGSPAHGDGAAAPAARRRGVALALAAALVVLAAMTFRQSRAFGDLETLWTRTIATNPRAFLALNNLGTLRQNARRRDQAEDLYRRAVEAQPTFAEARYNLGYLLFLKRDFAGAFREYEALVTLAPGKAEELLRFLKAVGADRPL
jgi:hypothetical protein